MAMVIPISFAGLLIPMRLHPAVILAPEPNGRSSGLGRLLKHSLQGRTRGMVSQLHVSSGQPHLVTTAARFFSGVETKRVLLDAALAGALVTHRGDRKRAVSLEDLAPMRFIRQLHPREFRLNLRTRA